MFHYGQVQVHWQVNRIRNPRACHSSSIYQLSAYFPSSSSHQLRCSEYFKVNPRHPVISPASVESIIKALEGAFAVSKMSLARVLTALTSSPAWALSVVCTCSGLIFFVK